MSNARQPRSSESRAADERQKEWVPPQKRVVLADTKDWHFRWVRESIVGKDDPDNMQRRLQEGYEVVHPDDELVREQVAMGHLVAKGGKVVDRGLVLMKISQKFAKQRNEYYTNQADLHQQSVDQALDRVRHPSMPLTEEAKRQTSRQK